MAGAHGTRRRRRGAARAGDAANLNGTGTLEDFLVGRPRALWKVTVRRSVPWAGGTVHVSCLGYIAALMNLSGMKAKREPY